MKQKVLFVLCLLMGLMFINSGLNKFFHYMPMPEQPESVMDAFSSFMKIGWLFPLVAVVEIVGGVLFILPKFRTLGAIILLPVMVGILLFHLVQAPSGIPIALVLFVINLWVIAENWKKYLPMFT